MPLQKPLNIPHIYVLARSYRDAYKVELSEFTAEGKKLVDLAGEGPVTRVFRASLEMKGPFVQPEWSKDFARALEQNIPGKRKSKAPILVVQGTVDNLVNPEDTRALLPRALASGNIMKISWYEGKGHRDVIEPARKEILQWFNDRLQGKPAPSDQSK
jgi:alpha-beta hydrolase superfamily lysophospholipase